MLQVYYTVGAMMDISILFSHYYILAARGTLSSSDSGGHVLHRRNAAWVHIHSGWWVTLCLTSAISKIGYAVLVFFAQGGNILNCLNRRRQAQCPGWTFEKYWAFPKTVRPMYRAHCRGPGSHKAFSIFPLSFFTIRISLPNEMC